MCVLSHAVALARRGRGDEVSTGSGSDRVSCSEAHERSPVDTPSRSLRVLTPFHRARFHCRMLIRYYPAHANTFFLGRGGDGYRIKISHRNGSFAPADRLRLVSGWTRIAGSQLARPAIQRVSIECSLVDARAHRSHRVF